MPRPFHPPRRSWPQKFRDALAGAAGGIRGQSSFRIHFLFTLLVLVAALLFGISLLEACLLALCVTIVLSAEMMNSALERIARAIDDRENEHLAVGLNTGSAAVLLAALGAVVVGLTVFIFRAGVLLEWWRVEVFLGR